MRGLWSGILHLSLGTYTSIAVSLAVNIVLVRVLREDGYGRLALLLMGSQLLFCFASAWTLSALVHFGAQEHQSTESIAKAFWARTVLILPGVAAALVITAICRRQLAGYFDVTVESVALVTAYFLATTLSSTAAAALQAAGRLSLLAVMIVLEKMLLLAMIVALLGMGRLGVPSVLVSYAASTSIIALVSLGSVWRLLQPRVAIEDVHKTWAYSLPLIGTTWIGIFGSQWIDYVVIRRSLALADVGLYSSSFQLAGVVQQVTIVVSTSLRIRFSGLVASGRHEDIAQIISRVVPYWLLSLSVLAGAAQIGSVAFIPFVFGKNFQPAVPAFILLMIATVLLGVFNTFVALLLARGETWTILAITGCSAAINTIGDLVLVPTGGIVGAAIATVVSYGLSATLVAVIVDARTKYRAVRCLVFVLPSILVYWCSVAMSRGWFHLIAPCVLLGSTLFISRRFLLFSSEDRVILGNFSPTAGRVMAAFALRETSK